jgi:hypothetical protein
MNLHTCQFILYRVVRNELTNRSVHFRQNSESRLVENELTNRSVQSLRLREMIVQTDQIDLYGEIEDEFTNKSTQS